MDNRSDGVAVIVQGDLRTIDRFSNDILETAPPASQIKSIEVIPARIEGYRNFSIAKSRVIDNLVTEISPDIAVCPDCLADLSEDLGRINYPLINCTNCGPRFSIISGLPYDRAQTSMKDFRMCERCGAEYNNILDRRFHAQPIACNNCGPQYTYVDAFKKISGFDLLLEETAAQITSGRIVAIKGTGGYYLTCDALRNDAVSLLRIRKHRDQKPFAVMFRDAASVSEYCHADKNELRELTSWRRPVVILRQKKPLAESVSSGLKTTGALLPYMPLHYLLFRKLKTPAIVMTSGNLSEEPVIIDDVIASSRLSSVADSIVSYNRGIINRVDDSVIRVSNNRVSLIRRSRGFVPRPVDLNADVEGAIAMGAEEKNTFCIGKGRQAIMSQYIGDLKNLGALDFYRESIGRFSDLFRFSPRFIACDMHPDYNSTMYGMALSGQLGIPVVRVQHHHAHIVSCMAEYGLEGKVIGISLDGTGYGPDEKIWGGEFLIADTEDYIRYTHFDYVPLPGGEQAVREPWRMAFSYLFRYFGDEIDYEKLPMFRQLDHDSFSLLKGMMVNHINSPESSGAGRLFDAVSAMLSLCTKSTFDSEAPMRLESVINLDTELFYPYTINKTVTFADTLGAILSELENKDVSEISAKFHNTVARVILDVSEMIRKEEKLNRVILSGGVFQNKYLLEKTSDLLAGSKFEVFTNHLVPSNDGGISLGQILIATNKIRKCV